MTDRLADVSARIDGIRQLGSVVNAMKGIAAARARSARDRIEAVDSYAATVAAAISSVLGPEGAPSLARPGGDRGGDQSRPSGTGLLVFCAEQGFAGAFTERVLDSLGPDVSTASLFLIGTRGLSIAAARGIAPLWSAPMSAHPDGVPKLADRIAGAIYRAVGGGRFDRLDLVHARRTAGQTRVLRRRLLPVDLSGLPGSRAAPPLTQVPREALIARLGADYVHALICRTALHAFAAENEARMEAMAAAGSQIERERADLEATLRRVRQEAITAEIIELGTGAATAGDAG